MNSPETLATTRSATDTVPLQERWIAGVLLVLAFALRSFYIFRYRYDSDEPQHLHTTWGWTQGLLQYRDFFDNHTPLFHILFSPLVAMLGERANILTFMRFAMVPLWFVSLWCVWKIGSRLFSRRVGLWAAVFISLLPWWFFCSVEYRTDNLWTPLWLGTMTVLLTGRDPQGRRFLGGLLLGLCFTVSMKTTLLFAVCMLAAIATPLICARRLALRETFRLALTWWPVLAGALIAPAALCGFFVSMGAWGAFKYGIIGHNILPGVDARNHPQLLRLVFPIALPFLLWAASHVARRSPNPAIAARRTFLFLVAGMYETALYSFWTLLTRQDDLPFYPLAMVLFAALVVWLIESRTAWSSGTAGTGSRLPWVLGTLALVEAAFVLGGRPPWIDGTQREREILGEMLRLTKPGEYVMDFKGESVFRQRAFYYVLEPLTFVRLRRGTITDTVANDVVAKKVRVVLNQNRWYPKAGAAFLAENYLAVGRTRVAGQVIGGKAPADGQPIKFEIRVPASYVAWADDHVASGTLDGSPWKGSRELAVGPHEFIPDGKHSTLYVLWSRAAELGFKPLQDQPGWQYFR